MKKIVAGSAAVFAVIVIACGGGSGQIGGACNSQDDCSGVSNTNNVGFCNQLGVCTRNCASHSDCGCAPNTTNADLADGKCGYSCVTVTATDAVCAKVCANNTQCKGTTTCAGAVDGSGNSLGYSSCI